MDADEPLWNAFFTVVAADGKVIGGGAYMHFEERDHSTLLTCAHVVNLALGREEFASEHPALAEVTLQFPAAPGARVTARVRRWWPACQVGDPEVPPERGQDGRWDADVAELEPTKPLPASLRPVPVATPELGDQVWAWRGNGDPRTAVRLRVNAPAGEWLVLEAPPTGFAVQPGYSGGPLWDRRRAAVVGLMVSAHERVPFSHMTTAVPIRQSYGIRGDVLRARLLGSEDPRGRIDSRISSLLSAQRQAAASFPYRSVELHRDDLTRVYVRQQLAVSADAEERNRAARDVAELESVDVRPPRTVEGILARFRHVLVMGDAGAGKSTLTLQLSAELVHVPALRGDAPMVLVPVRVSARHLAARPEGELRAAVSAAAQAEIAARLHIDIGDELCVRPPAGMEWLFIVDGLDEVQDANARADLAERLRRFMDVATGYRLLMTTRELSSRESSRWASRDDLGRCEIEPFERDQRRDFVHRWFRDRPELADAFLAQISRARLEEVVSIPLLATVAAIVFEEQAGKPLPQTAFALYQRFVSHLYESRVEQLIADLRTRLAGWADADHIMDRLVTGRINLLEQSAAAWLRGAQPLQAALDWLRTVGAQPYPQPTNWPDVVSAVLTSTGLVIHDGADLTFVHRKFAEHLAAAGEARRLPSPFDADDRTWWRVLRGALADNNPRDREVVLHRALLADSTYLLDWLLAGDDQARELGARLIFEGVPSTPAHHESLAETMGYWASRISRASTWAAQLVRVLDTVGLAPPAVADALVELLDARLPLGVRDAAIRALLRSGTAHDQAVQALVAIMNERPLTGAQRVRAAQMLADLGAEARALARAGLVDITYEHDWVMSDDRGQAAKLIEELDNARSLPDEFTRDAIRHAAGATSGTWEHSTLLLPAERDPATVRRRFRVREESSPIAFRPGAGNEPHRSRAAGLYEKTGFHHGRPPLLPGLRAALGLPVDDRADPSEEEENDLAGTAEVVLAAVKTGAVAPAVSGTDRGTVGHGDARQREGAPVAQGPGLSEERPCLTFGGDGES
ncbi:NACHT domain-containing protein (plasmid) [Streptomyces sp. R39]|uniref:NACHT domain-containing protein n=1 Tax=Streptomyces sp. R39 TaxID=3238631 RepID=A0AB39R4X2_9ACTN